MREGRPLTRYLQLGGGALLLLAAAIMGPLPGPGGIFLAAAGLVLVLRASSRAKRFFARAKRRWPRACGLLDRAMRRGSALRRHARDRALRPEPRVD